MIRQEITERSAAKLWTLMTLSGRAKAELEKAERRLRWQRRVLSSRTVEFKRTKSSSARIFDVRRRMQAAKDRVKEQAWAVEAASHAIDGAAREMGWSVLGWDVTDNWIENKPVSETRHEAGVLL